MRGTQSVIVGVGGGYLLVVAWSVANLPYDLWGALVVVPVLALVGVLIVRTMFDGKHAALRPLLYAGLAAKLVGVLARYWVGFEAYGRIDAQNYHDKAAAVAGAVWGGETDVWSALPRGTGTEFQEHFTAFVYTLTGTSKLGGFVMFGFLAYVGVLCFVKAALIAVPDIAARRYALFCMLTPSLIYWPSSIGKEAVLILQLGVGTLGIALLLAGRRTIVAITLVVAGLGSASLLRPHVAALWLAGLFVSLLVVLARGRSGRRSTATDRLVLGLVVVVVGVGLVAASQAAVQFLSPSTDETLQTSVRDILDETTRRTAQAGSNFTPPSTASPVDWPYAAVRTLTRPLPGESSGLAQHLAAAEIGALFVLLAASWRRVRNLGWFSVNNGYVTLVVATCFFVGLAYSSFANLGVLTRQKSLIFPFLLLIPCLPLVRSRSTPKERQLETAPETVTSRTTGDAHWHVRPGPAERQTFERVDIDEFWAEFNESPSAVHQKSSMSPSDKDQLGNGGGPRSLRARHVRTGPPPGNGSQADDIWG